VALKLVDLGEFGLIDRIERLASGLSASDVVLGIGDDAALLRTRPGEDLALSSDALVERVHFRLDREDARKVGRRALVAGLSDLAAMGARPLGFTLALAAPPSRELRVVLGLVRGLLDVARRERCPLVGGNVTRARELQLTLTVAGAVSRGRALRRDQGRPGDRIFVTGTLGRPALARLCGRPARPPRPRLEVGRRLARLPGRGACIDVSDGLLADLAHLCRASGVAARLRAERIPLPRGFAAACRDLGTDPRQLALCGGEDYELCFTLRPGALDGARLSRRLGAPVREIGFLEPGAGVQVSPPLPPGSPGWRHF